METTSLRYSGTIEDRRPADLSTNSDVLSFVSEILRREPEFVFEAGGKRYRVFGYANVDLTDPRTALNPDDLKARSVGMGRRVQLLALEEETDTPVAMFSFFGSGVEPEKFVGQAIDVDPQFQGHGIGFAFWVDTQKLLPTRIRPSGTQTDSGAKLLNRLMDQGHIDFHGPYPPL